MAGLTARPGPVDGHPDGCGRWPFSTQTRCEDSSTGGSLDQEDSVPPNPIAYVVYLIDGLFYQIPPEAALAAAVENRLLHGTRVELLAGVVQGHADQLRVSIHDQLDGLACFPLVGVQDDVGRCL